MRKWNRRKPELCPRCYAPTDLEKKSAKGVVTCCTCGQRFTKHPLMSPVLPRLGIVCEHHEGIGAM